MALSRAVRLKENWAYFIKNNMLEDLLKLYDNNATFKGTFVKKITNNKYDISKYFKDLIPKTNKVVFLKNNVVRKEKDLIIDTGRYNFHTSDGVILAQYQFIFSLKDKDIKIISHYSSFMNN